MELRLTRRRAFEASHRYEHESPYGHGHNYVCQATVAGPLDEPSGMVVNVKELDEALAAVVAPLDHRFLNVEWSPLGGREPTTEVIASILHRQLAERVRGWPVRVAAVRLYETDEAEMICLTRVYSFSAAHRLHNPALSDEQNRALFGKCNREHGHGHDYRLEVTVGGELDPRRGTVVDLAELDRVVQERVLARWDHRHLNHEVPEFRELNPTSENVVRVAWELLAPHISSARLEKLVLWETPKSAFEYRGEQAASRPGRRTG